MREGLESKEGIEEQDTKPQYGEGQDNGLFLHQDILGKGSTC